MSIDGWWSLGTLFIITAVIIFPFYWLEVERDGFYGWKRNRVHYWIIRFTVAMAVLAFTSFFIAVVLTGVHDA